MQPEHRFPNYSPVLKHWKRNKGESVMDKKNILNEINSAFIMLSRIPVTGDSVDAMAVARAKLRKVYGELEKADNKEVCEVGKAVDHY